MNMQKGNCNKIMSLLMGGNDNKSISEAMAISASLLAH